MEAKELRLGNLLFRDNNFIGEVTEINSSVVELLVVGNYWPHGLDQIKPIPLTEEWLLKFGFDESGYYYVLNGVRIDEPFSPRADINSEYYAFYDQEIKYVHSLQNLYFALTGKELTLTATTPQRK